MCFSFLLFCPTGLKPQSPLESHDTNTHTDKTSELYWIPWERTYPTIDSPVYKCTHTDPILVLIRERASHVFSSLHHGQWQSYKRFCNLASSIKEAGKTKTHTHTHTHLNHLKLYTPYCPPNPEAVLWSGVRWQTDLAWPLHSQSAGRSVPWCLCGWPCADGDESDPADNDRDTKWRKAL